MEPDKNPRNRWPSAGFYKTIWKDLSPLLITAFIYAHDTGTLSITQRRGIIKLSHTKETFRIILFFFFLQKMASTNSSQV